MEVVGGLSIMDEVLGPSRPSIPFSLSPAPFSYHTVVDACVGAEALLSMPVRQWPVRGVEVGLVDVVAPSSLLFLTKVKCSRVLPCDR